MAEWSLQATVSGHTPGTSTTDGVAVLKGIGGVATSGTSAGEATQVFTRTDSIAASTTDTYDLQALTSFVGSLGVAPSTASEVFAIFIKAASTNGSTVTINPASTNNLDGVTGGSGGSIVLTAGSWYAFSDVSGLAISGSAKDFDITNDDGSNAASVDIVVLVR